MALLNLPKRQWYPIRDSSVSFEITYPQNASLVQTISTLQCNREYIVHMFSEIPRVILLESGTHCYEELNSNSNCSSKLAGLGIENFSLSQTSNNIVYTTGNDISIVNIQSDKISTPIKGDFRWKNVLFNPEDDRFFVSWSENCVYIWNRSVYELKLTQLESQNKTASKSPQSHDIGLSSCIRLYYSNAVSISKCNFAGKYVVVFTKKGFCDIVPIFQAPGEYFRSLGSRSILGKNELLLDVIVFPNAKLTEDSDLFEKMFVSTLSVTNGVYKVELLSFPVDIEKKDFTLLQSISVHIAEENKCISQHIANFITPFWGDYFAIHIFNQIMIFSIGNDFFINGVYLFPSRILETAAFRPPRNISWVDIGAEVAQKKITCKHPIEVFVSNIFGGLESIIVPSLTQVDSSSTTDEVHASSEGNSTQHNCEIVNISESKNDVTDDYYSALISNSCIKVDKSHSQNDEKLKTNNDRSDILSSLFGTLGLNGETEGSRQRQVTHTNVITDNTANESKKREGQISKEIQTIFGDFACEIKNTFSEILNEKIAPINENIKEIKLLLSDIYGISNENTKALSSLKKVEALANEQSNKFSKKFETIDSRVDKVLKESKTMSEKISKINKNLYTKNGSSLEDLARVIADSFGTLTNVVSDLQSTINRFESHMNNLSSNNVVSNDNRIVDQVRSNEIAAQIDDALSKKQYDRAFAIAISADQAAITSQPEKGYFNLEECWVHNISQKFDPCIWLDSEPLPISYPVILGISKILTDTIPYLIISIKDLYGVAQQSRIADLKMRILWIKETIHCFEPSTDTLTPNDIIQILNEISETINKCINLINVFQEGTKDSNCVVPVCFTDGSILSDITSILRQIRRITRNITSNFK